MVKLETNHGVISIELDTTNTPNTAQNFLDYVKEGFYNDTIFHRVIDGFMVQGGGFSKDMKQKETKAPIQNEGPKSAPNKRGTLAMARTSDPHSASCQFFINVKDNDFLNYKSSTPDGWGYCVFGRVTDGMDVIDKIRQVKTGSKMGHQDVPVDEVVLLKAWEE